MDDIKYISNLVDLSPLFPEQFIISNRNSNPLNNYSWFPHPSVPGKLYLFPVSEFSYSWYCISMESNNIFPFISSSFHWKWCLHSIGACVKISFLLWLSNIPLYACTIFFTYSSDGGLGLFPHFGLFWIMLLWTLCCGCLNLCFQLFGMHSWEWNC